MIEQRLHLMIICEDEYFFNWIASTIKVSDMMVNAITRVNIDKLSEICILPSCDQLLIIQETLYLQNVKKINSNYASMGHEFPLLLVTDSYADNNDRKDAFTIIDTIVKESLSIYSLRHAIRSLLKDYKLTKRLQRLAHYDALTGAANRYLFDDRMNETLKKSKRNKESFSLLYFDLNGFKVVNDTYGHQVGDLFLKHFVLRLNQVKRETDTLARLGGDEFCMLLPNTNEKNLAKFIVRIIDSFSTPFLDFNIQLPIKSAIGGVTIRDQNESMLSPQEIVKIADKCVYEAKQSKETHSVVKVI
ncbi:GGDEF domain-containing protein [Psychromonas arctica]|uniref:GGDEF domain-containing protein n=1 Tax=Psychromonas arctica TaxID=168275 RepID=UPI000416A2C5|nr:GGDEF domain-containing protein [Psychromonas arctica]